MSALYFNSNNIGAIDGVDLYNYDAHALPERDIKINKIARRDLSIITSAEYVSKDIPAWADICSGTRADTEATVAEVKALLQAQNGELVVEQSGLNVTYTATLQEFNIEWNGNKAYVEMVFVASDPIGRADATTLFTETGVTVSSYAENVTVLGSSTAYPKFTVQLGAVTGGTNAHVTIQNAKTNQGIRVERDWTAGDLMTVDSELMEVRVNGDIVDFSGMFPQFPAGSQQVRLLDSFATRSYDASATYRPKLV